MPAKKELTVTLQFLAEKVRLPRGKEPLRRKLLNLQVLLTKIASEQEPLTTKLIDPFNSGILNLSSGVKVVNSCAKALVAKEAKVNAMIRIVIDAVLMLGVFNASLYG